MGSAILTPEPSIGFADRVRAAVIWRWGSQALAQLVTWTATILVVRLLDPRDYGLFAMTQTVVTALNFLNGYGFATTLIQSKEIDDHRVGQVFGLLIVSNVALAVTQWLGAPLAAHYYGQPMVGEMLRVQSLIFLATPFICLPSALLARRLDFRRQAAINMICAFVGAGAALGLAWFGHGVWALVLAPICVFATRALGLTLANGGLVRPVFDFRGAGDIVTFGTTLTLCQLCWILQSQADIAIAGRSFETHDLGLYSEALFLTLIFTGRFLPPLNEVAYPAYAELNNEGKSLAPAFLSSVQLTMLVAIPFYVGLSLVAEPLVATFFGPKWLGMIPVVAGLALAMPAMTLQIICSPATTALGRPGLYLATSAMGATIMPICFLFGVAGGPHGMVTAWQIAAPLLLAGTLAITLPALGARLIDLARVLAPPALACAAMAAGVVAVARITHALAPPFELALLAATGATIYLCTLSLVWPRVVRETLAKLRKTPTDVSSLATPTTILPSEA